MYNNFNLLDNIYILPNKEQVPIPEIEMMELLNWPWVFVEFVSPELSFKRSNCGEFTRFLSMIVKKNPSKPEFLEGVEIINPSIERHCYTSRLLESYVKQYLKILRTAKDVIILPMF